MPGDERDRLRTAYEDRVRVLNEAIAERERELLVLSRVAARVHAEEGVQAIFDIAIEEILEQLGLDAAWIFTGDDREKELRLVAWRGVAASWLEEVRTTGLTECLCPEVFWSGHRMQARNTMQCPRMPDIIEGLKAPVAHACIPLKFEGATRGVLNVAARPGLQFSEEELRFLETLGHQVALAVERARHRAAERVRNQEARALAALSKAMGGALSVKDVLPAVGATAREVLGVDRVAIYLGSDPQRLVVAHLSGLEHPELQEGQVLDLVAQEARLQLEALRSRRVLWVDDVARDPRLNRDLAHRWKATSGVVIPLLGRDRPIGLVVLACTEPHHWTEEQIEVAEALGAQAAVALENARLYDEARRAYLELKEAQARIIQSEKMAVLGTFASGLAHEVRNPLNSIALQLSILERRIARMEGGLGKEMAELSGIIREEVSRLDGLVGDFLLFSRTTRIHHKPAHLEALVDEVVRLLRPEARAAGVTLAHETRGEPIPSLQLDAEKMKQVVINLVRNSIEAMPDGGAITIESGVAGGQARLAVRDTGPGLPEGLDVFQLFVTTKPKGTGLGLSIVQQIVLQHGGEIEAANEPAGGASFTIRLPLPAGAQEGVGA